MAMLNNQRVYKKKVNQTMDDLGLSQQDQQVCRWHLNHLKADWTANAPNSWNIENDVRQSSPRPGTGSIMGTWWGELSTFSYVMFDL